MTEDRREERASSQSRPICKIDCIHLVLCRESQNVLGGYFRVIQGNTILQRISCSDSLICGGNCTQSPLVVDDRVIVDTASIAEDATFGAESGQLLPDGNLVVEIGEIREEKIFPLLQALMRSVMSFAVFIGFYSVTEIMQLCDIYK